MLQDKPALYFAVKVAQPAMGLIIQNQQNQRGFDHSGLSDRVYSKS
jgi:hypothetical protein